MSPEYRGIFQLSILLKGKLRGQFLSYMTNMPLIETSGAKIVIKYCMRSVSLLSKY